MEYRERMKGIYHENLESKIEQLRRKLHITALEKGISHPDVLIVSQRLDEVINRFCKLGIIKSSYSID